jgi:polyisoprenoid-binding protein YceI
MPRLAALAILILNISFAQAQKYVIEKSYITFFSDATIEDIKADNTKATGIFNAANSEIVFSILISEFQFEKSLMKEHFNEKYMESEKYPKALFHANLEPFDVSKSGNQAVVAKGKLTIHGVTRDVAIPGTIMRDGDTFLMNAKFIVRLADYKIEIPELFWQRIAEQVEVTVDFTFKPQ